MFARGNCHVLDLKNTSIEYSRFFVTLTMSSRISIARPQSASNYNPDPHGFSNSRPSSGYRSANPDDPLEKIRAFSKQVEDNVEIYSQPLKPRLPAIGRFLIVVTFLEDALRIMTQWGDQIWYLQQYVLLVRLGSEDTPLWLFSVFFIILNGVSSQTQEIPLGNLTPIPHH